MSPSERATATRSSLEAQLRPPSRRAALIERPRLFAKLDRLSAEKLTLVTAPAGYGKTSLLSTWAARRRPGEVAWLSLERGAGQSTRFWRDVAESVERARPRTGRRAAALLRARGVAPDVAVHELVSDLAEVEPLAIVLDDLHLVGDRDCFELLAYALEHLPPGIRIVAGTRMDLPLPVGRLRAHRLLGEIRARDLAFTHDEARELLIHAEGLDLDDDEIALLVERTEGWPVAVYLTALWLRDQEDAPIRVRELAAGQQFLGEYLTDEFLTSVDTETRSFLVRTSVLMYLSSSLCDAALERDDSAEMLRRISASNLLVAQLEPGSEWFRVHPLFRDLLRLELERDDPAAIVGIHRRAAVWLREHGYLEGTVVHAVDAGEHAQAAASISESWEELLNHGHAEMLIRLVEYLPPETLLSHPDLVAATALATCHARQPVHERNRWLAVVERSRQTSPATWSPRAAVTASLAQAIAVDGDPAEAAKHARRALRLVHRHRMSEGEVSALSALAYALYLEGDDDEAVEQAAKALAVPDAPDRANAVLRALGVLALVAVDAGRVDDAESKVQEAVDYASDKELYAAASAHVAHLARAKVMLARGRLRTALSAADLAERLCRTPDPSLQHALSSLVLAQVRTWNGLLDGARTSLHEAGVEIEAAANPGRLPRLLTAGRRQLRAARKTHARSTEPLSRAEQAVLRLLATDLSQRGIGRQLYLSVNTVKTHTRSIYRKLGVTARADAVARATALELIHPE